LGCDEGRGLGKIPVPHNPGKKYSDHKERGETVTFGKHQPLVGQNKPSDILLGQSQKGKKRESNQKQRNVNRGYGTSLGDFRRRTRQLGVFKGAKRAKSSSKNNEKKKSEKLQEESRLKGGGRISLVRIDTTPVPAHLALE